jgi:hypothetical protein
MLRCKPMHIKLVVDVDDEFRSDLSFGNLSDSSI